jgi:hypothetical protein
MFAGGYFSLSFAEVVGLLVTIVSVYFVVKQLREAKLASQMEGVIAIQLMERKHIKSAKQLNELLETDEWQDLDGEEAHSMIKNTDAYWDGYLEYAATYGLLSGLVRAKAIDIHLAYEQWGFYVPSRWRTLEKFTYILREKLGNSTINDNWEWLASEFEKLNR